MEISAVQSQDLWRLSTPRHSKPSGCQPIGHLTIITTLSTRPVLFASSSQVMTPCLYGCRCHVLPLTPRTLPHLLHNPPQLLQATHTFCLLVSLVLFLSLMLQRIPFDPVTLPAQYTLVQHPSMPILLSVSSLYYLNHADLPPRRTEDIRVELRRVAWVMPLNPTRLPMDSSQFPLKLFRILAS